MDRRKFVRTTGTALGAAALGGGALASRPSDAGGAGPDPGSGRSPSPSGSSPPGPTADPDPTAPARIRHPGSAPRVVVVGAGAFGGWTALHLAERGATVTLVDAFGPGSARATSGGDSRGLRFAYGDREIYTRWAVEALRRWSERQEAWAREPWGQELMVTTGRLSFFPEITRDERTVKEILDRNGVESELLDPDEIGRRWPQIALDGVGAALWEPEATAIRAYRACQVVARAAEAAGAEVRTARAGVPSPAAGGRGGGVPVDGEETLEADLHVFACGPWLAGLFPDLLGDRIEVPRRDVFFLGPPPGDARFSHPNLPNFSEGSHSVYGFPDLDGLGFKVAPFGGIDPFDPDTDERVVAAHWLRRARAYLALRFPDMADQPLVHGRVCQLENTPDGHFVVDRHPAMENVWIVGGGSGHGFKHGPVLGDYVARRLLGEDPEPELAELFRLPG